MYLYVFFVFFFLCYCCVFVCVFVCVQHITLCCSVLHILLTCITSLVSPPPLYTQYQQPHTQHQHPHTQYQRSLHALQLLESSTDAKGRPVRVVKLPLPQPLFYTEEEATGVQTVPGTIPREPNTRMAASYVNFYIANGGVVMPLFGVPEDVAAQRVLAEVFPDRQVVGVQTREVLLGGGNIHCITQQQPRAGYPAPGL